jgi:hypothetical protein
MARSDRPNAATFDWMTFPSGRAQTVLTTGISGRENGLYKWK